MATKTWVKKGNLKGPKGDVGDWSRGALTATDLLNDLFTEGKWSINSATIAAAVGSPISPFGTVEVLGVGASAIQRVHGTDVDPRVFERGTTTGGASWGEWRRTDKDTKKVLHQLSLAGASTLNEVAPARHVRRPFKFPVQVDASRLYFRNFNDRDATSYGDITFVGSIWVGKRAKDANGVYTEDFAAAPIDLGAPVRTTLTDGSYRWSVPTSYYKFEANTEYLVTYGYTTPAGQVTHVGYGGSYLGTVPGAASYQDASGMTWSTTAPLDVYFTLLVPADTPVYGYLGSSTAAGVNTDNPVQDSFGWRHAYASGALPVLLAHSGSGMTSWDDTGDWKWEKARAFARMDRLYFNIGSNDVYDSAVTLATLQTRNTAVAKVVRSQVADQLFYVNIAPRANEDPAIQTKRLAYNDWLETLPNGALATYDVASTVTGTDGSMDPAYNSGDNVHLNTLGQAKTAEALIRGGDAAWSGGDAQTLTDAKAYTDAQKFNKGTTSADLNTVQATGRYNVDATTLANLPAATTGSLIVLWASTSGTQMYVTRETTPRVFYRRYAFGAWEAWSEGALAARVTTLEGAKWDKGTTSADLNTLQTSGRYNVTSTALANLPAATVGSVEVLWSSTTGVQIYTTREASPKVFYRNYSASTWGAWVNQTLVEAKAYTDTQVLPSAVLKIRGDIASGTNLNLMDTQTDSGIWAVPSTVVASIIGLPDGATTNGLLENECYASWTAMQRYYEHGGSGRVWHRTVRNPSTNTWWNWNLVSSGPPTLSEDWVHFGDSLTDDVVMSTTQWTRVLATKTGNNHENRGWYNAKSFEISVRAGANLYPVTIPSGSIPATGTVTVVAGRTQPLAFGGYTGLMNRQIPGTLFGRRGYLQNPTNHATDMVFTVTDKTGSTTTVGTTTKYWFEADSASIMGRIGTIWLGTNDRTTETPERLVALVDEIRENLLRSRRSFVFGLLQDPNGTWTTRISAINAAYKAAFPGQYLDVNAHLISDQAAVDAGITYTAQDNIDRASGYPPTSFRSDTVHLNADGAKALAEYVYREAQARGWA